ncbi:GNAT family N-acetyltransferase [Streptomyces rubiginosohelvolus]
MPHGRKASDGSTTLHGTLTRLVPTTEADLDLLAGWFASPDFVRYWGGVPLSRTEVAAKYVGRRRPRVRSYLVLQPDAQGRGLGPDATRALLAHLGGELGWRRVTVDPVRENVRAVRAWEKAGFWQVPGEPGDLLMEFRFP